MELELDDVVLEDALDALESVIQRRSVMMESVRVSILRTRSNKERKDEKMLDDKNKKKSGQSGSTFSPPKKQCPQDRRDKRNNDSNNSTGHG